MILPGYKIYLKTENEKLHAIMNTGLAFVKPGCVRYACQPQQLLNILRSEPWLLIKWLLM